ncbi:MAG: Na+/H+ antiporter subunit E [Mesorhizobium sp.]|nr:Na+/H+ antiporter subunit E [Mesorhizobium sp.]
MARLVTLFILLSVFWLLLSGLYYAWLLIVGLLVVVLAVWTAWRMGLVDDEGLPINLSVGALTYWPWLCFEIVKSALLAARIILDPKLPISPTMVRIKSSQKTAAGFTTFANSLTLTPGTISVEATGSTGEILVHALTGDLARELEEGSLDRRVTRFEAGA